MFATNSDYEEAIKESRIHAYEYRKNKKRVFLKLLSFTSVAVLLFVGFNYYKKHSMETENLFNNIKLRQKVLDISREEEDSLQKKFDEDAYLTALESMEVDILADSHPKSTSTSLTSKVIHLP